MLKRIRVRHVNLFFAMIISLVGAVVIAFVAAGVLAGLLTVDTEATTSPVDLTKLALTIAAGVGGVVALVVAYRRQRDLEQGRFVEGFGAAAKQLGDSDVAVRLAGVYAMAGVADQTSKLKRQQCIDVLCGYLRLPYAPELGSNHQSGLTLKRAVGRKGGPEEELRFHYRQNDKEVRQTIVRVMTAHLQKKATQSWSAHDFDFDGSHLEDPDFKDAIFNGKAWFYGASFSGDKASFKNVSFSGETTTFKKATFGSVDTSFSGATFSSKDTSFSGTTFSGGTTSFSSATFRGNLTWFGGTTFSSDTTKFSGAAFEGNMTRFRGATFSGKDVLFDGATFGSRNTSFDWATFNGQVTSFRGSDFGEGKVTFRSPMEWNPPPAFDWDAGSEAAVTKPANVEPQNWPPVATGHIEGPPAGADPLKKSTWW